MANTDNKDKDDYQYKYCSPDTVSELHNKGQEDRAKDKDKYDPPYSLIAETILGGRAIEANRAYDQGWDHNKKQEKEGKKDK